MTGVLINSTPYEAYDAGVIDGKASRDAEIADLKVVSDHNLATYHQAAKLLREEIAELKELVRLIFESTPPYREDGTCVFSDLVIEKWKELLP